MVPKVALYFSADKWRSFARLQRFRRSHHGHHHVLVCRLKIPSWKVCIQIRLCVIFASRSHRTHTSSSPSARHSPMFPPPTSPTQSWFLLSVTPDYVLRKNVTGGEGIPPVFSSTTFYFYRRRFFSSCHNPHRRVCFEKRNTRWFGRGVCALQDILADWQFSRLPQEHLSGEQNHEIGSSTKGPYDVSIQICPKLMQK